MLLHTTKYDGSLHYRFNVQVVHEDAEVLAVYRRPDVELESYRGTFQAPGHLLNVFYRSHYHNVVIMWQRDWTPRMHYVNIATPATWDSKRVTAADMDLDVLRFAEKDEVIVDDEDEFEEHQVSMAYPLELVARCLAETQLIRQRMTAREGMFADAIFDWRHGDDLAGLLG